MSIKAAIEEFTERLHHLIESDAIERARAAVLHAFGAGAPKKLGRLPKALAASSALAGKVRRKGPVQLCPVPGCKNPAAPIFGMVCADHKGLPKAKIKKYREARRTAKLAGKPAPQKRGRKAAPRKAVRNVKAKSRAKSTKKKPAKKSQTTAKVTPTEPATPSAA